jgi:coproporphyrinogen III oxidase-like Fe-S oxidoreductase
MLRLRLAEGLPRSLVPAPAVARLIDDGLLQPAADRVVLTLRGRLLADAVVRALL